MTKTVVLNPFTLDLDSHSDSHGTANNEPSQTVQADLEQSDINFIVKQFGMTHSLPYGVAVPVYDDYSDIPNDYHAALQLVSDSNSTFMEYPADVRTRFDNDPGKFLEFVHDPSNYEEASSLGLLVPKPASLKTEDTKSAGSSKKQTSASASDEPSGE